MKAIHIASVTTKHLCGSTSVAVGYVYLAVAGTSTDQRRIRTTIVSLHEGDVTHGAVVTCQVDTGTCKIYDVIRLDATIGLNDLNNLDQARKWVAHQQL